MAYTARDARDAPRTIPSHLLLQEAAKWARARYPDREILERQIMSTGQVAVLMEGGAIAVYPDDV